MGVTLEFADPLVGLARLLRLDASVAGEAGDGARAADDLASLVRLAGHSCDVFSLITQLMSASIFQMAVVEFDRALNGSPDLFSDEQLVELAHTIAGFRHGNVGLDFTGERMMFMDTMQRLFTDDGSGGGRLCAAGVGSLGGETLFEVLRAYDVWPKGLNTDGSALAPVFSSLSASRKEMVRQYETFMDIAERQAATPLWRKEGNPTGLFIARLCATPVDRARYWAIDAFTPAINRAAMNAEIIAQTRDATLVAIALEMYKRRSGAYPESLDALVPEFLPSVPPDRYTGKPLNYRLDQAGRPVLYSVGVDRDDDGGRPTVDEHGARDDFAGRLGASLAQFSAMPPEKQREYDGDWILFPPEADSN